MFYFYLEKPRSTNKNTGTNISSVVESKSPVAPAPAGDGAYREEEDEEDSEPGDVLPVELTGRPRKIRRTEKELQVQLAFDHMAIDQGVALAAPNSWAPVKFTVRQGPSPNNGKIITRPAAFLMPSSGAYNEHWASKLSFLGSSNELTIPWCAEAVVTTKKEGLGQASASDGQVVALQYLPSRSGSGTNQRQNGVDGMSKIIEEMVIAAQSGHAKAFIVVALGDCGDVPLALGSLQAKNVVRLSSVCPGSGDESVLLSHW